MEANPKAPLCNAKDYFEQQWPDIDSHTGDSRWLGETMDYGMAVDGILACQKKVDASSRPNT
jgi:hypothetical protein